MALAQVILGEEHLVLHGTWPGPRVLTHMPEFLENKFLERCAPVWLVMLEMRGVLLGRFSRHKFIDFLS